MKCTITFRHLKARTNCSCGRFMSSDAQATLMLFRRKSPIFDSADSNTAYADFNLSFCALYSQQNAQPALTHSYQCFSKQSPHLRVKYTSLVMTQHFGTQLGTASAHVSYYVRHPSYRCTKDTPSAQPDRLNLTNIYAQLVGAYIPTSACGV
jgi:hypothetical protein